MNRNIKYRAWLKDSKLMVDVDEIDIGRKFIYYYYHSDDLEGELKSFKNIELMQYTGLRDKNEKEVYEGDILKLRANYGIGVVKYYNEWGAYIVEYLKSKPIVVLGMNYDKEDIEIIGNIWENKELLEVKNE